MNQQKILPLFSFGASSSRCLRLLLLKNLLYPFDSFFIFCSFTPYVFFIIILKAKEYQKKSFTSFFYTTRILLSRIWSTPQIYRKQTKNENSLLTLKQQRVSILYISAISKICFDFDSSNTANGYAILHFSRVFHFFVHQKFLFYTLVSLEHTFS
jgi:hypothetical protein